MEWAIDFCVEELCDNDDVTSISRIIHEFSGIQSVKTFTVEKTHNALFLNFVVVAEEMPIGRNLVKTLSERFPVSSVNVTRECWTEKEDVAFQWVNKGVTSYSDGSVYHRDCWSLHVGGQPVLDVNYVPTFTRDWTTREYRKFFDNETFCMMLFGKLTPLKARNIEAALQEAESFYEDSLKSRAEDFERRAASLREQMLSFNKWKES